MEAFIDKVLGSPMLLAIAIGLLIVIVYAVLKKLFKMALFLLLILIGALVWFEMTGTPMPDELEALKEKGKETYESVRDGVKKAGETAKDVKDGLDKLGD